MTLVHPLLLAGLLLVGVPVLIHLIMQQKPKTLPFPAFRFLLQKYRTNQRRLRLRHLLLLGLRMALIAAMCFALAQPMLRSVPPFLGRLFSQREASAAVVLLFDTSPSMEYKANGVSRLDDAKQLAQQLLNELPGDSRVAVLDSAEAGGEWLPSPDQARARLAALQPRPANAPVSRLLPAALRLLADLDIDGDGARKAPPRFVYIFSDRAEASWDSNNVRTVPVPPGVTAVFVNVGVEKPDDVAVTDLEMSRPVVGPGGRLEVRATLQNLGPDREAVVSCLIDDVVVQQRSVKVQAGQPQAEMFVVYGAAQREAAGQPAGVAPGFHRVEVRLQAEDNLPFNNQRFATFEVRAGRPILLLADHPQDAAIWGDALELTGRFACTIQSPDAIDGKTPNELLSSYRAVGLVNLARPKAELWETLKDYVEKGGGLLVVPGGEEIIPSAYNQETAQRVLPGRFLQVAAKDRPLDLDGAAAARHPFTKRFQEVSSGSSVDYRTPARWPRVTRSWEVQLPEGDVVTLLSYNGEPRSPALVERILGKGRVLLVTTALDGRRQADPDFQKRWNNYWGGGSSFGLVLANLLLGHLAGDADEADFNFLCGQAVTLPVPPLPFFPLYTLQGPGVAGGGATVARAKDQNQVQITQAEQPGNYTLLDPDSRTSRFSLNVRGDESRLTPVPVEAIEGVLGEGAVLRVDPQGTLRDALQSRGGQPGELLFWVMLLLLLAMAVENLLANKFYRRPAATS